MTAMLLRLKDGKGGQAIQYVNVELVPTNIPPIFTSLVPENPKAQVGKAFYYQAIAQDPDGDTLTYSLVTGAPSGVSINPQTGLVTWTPNNSQLGTREFTLKVADGKGGETTQTLALTVNVVTPNQAPLITSTPRTTTRTGNSYFYQIQATDTDGDRLTYSLSSPPEGMTITDGIIAWESTAPPKQVIIT